MRLFKESFRYLFIAIGGIFAFPFALLSFVEKQLTEREWFFTIGAHAVSQVPGLPGNFVRTAYYLMTLEKFHPTAVMSFGSVFTTRQARVEARAGVGLNSVLGKVELGKSARIASRVSVVSGLHQHGTAASYTTRDDDHGAKTRVVIGEKAWIGEGATVGADVGDGAVVAMGAVVLQPVPMHTMAMGNPARLLPLGDATPNGKTNSQPTPSRSQPPDRCNTK